MPSQGGDAEELVRRLGGRWTGEGGICRCPAHDDRTPSLSISDQEGKILVHCHAGCSQAAVLKSLKQRGLWPGAAPAPRNEARERRVRSRDNFETSGVARRLWASSSDAVGTLVENYLRGRAVDLPPAGQDAIRFNPALRHPNGTWPGMIAAITDAVSGQIIGVHRTFLAPMAGSKAPVKPDRMVLGRKRGGVIRLVSDGAVGARLAYAEGIETALSAISAGWLCWSAIDAGNMASLPVWSWIDLTIFVDHDAAGIAAAQTLATRWRHAGGSATLIRAPRPGEDWNDVARRIARAA